MPQPHPTGDATRRTWLAAERTWLAWLRTGLAFEAIALAVGKLVPAVAETTVTWPYEAIGAAYGVLGVIVLVYAIARRRAVEAALPRGEYVSASDGVLLGTLAAAAVLGLATVAVVLAT
jgi:putative membrane protein